VLGAIAPGVARGLKLRHDHGSNYMSGDFQDEIECLGIEASPSFVREPRGQRRSRALHPNLTRGRSGRGGRSKYPPAEPGALRCEPLKAAIAASHVTLIGLIASPKHWKQPVLAPSRALTNRTSFAPCFASAACVHLPIKARERFSAVPPFISKHAQRAALKRALSTITWSKTMQTMCSVRSKRSEKRSIGRKVTATPLLPLASGT
jgi:hypothetical protein